MTHACKHILVLLFTTACFNFLCGCYFLVIAHIICCHPLFINSKKQLQMNKFNIGYNKPTFEEIYQKSLD
jgi:hypothetical protein